MKLKKLIPAFALLLISAVVMSTASFAWFSMNNEVTATGMSVTAQAPTSLLISNTSATAGFGSTVSLENATENADGNFVPVSYAGVCASWYKLKADGMADVNESGVLSSENQVNDGAEASVFTSKNDIYEVSTSVYHDTVWLKSEGDENINVQATVSYNDGSSNLAIKNAMHVIFIVDGTIISTIDMGGSGDDLKSAKLATLTANANGTQVEIYYFLSGNDTDCKNSNITADATMSVTITFAKMTTQA